VSEQVFFSTDNGVTWKAASPPGDNTSPGTHAWTVPNVTKGKCKVKVILIDATGKKFIGVSGAFAID
jgi:hypothetical protein